MIALDLDRPGRRLCSVGVSPANQGFFGECSEYQLARRTRVLHRRNALSLTLTPGLYGVEMPIDSIAHSSAIVICSSRSRTALEMIYEKVSG